MLAIAVETSPGNGGFTWSGRRHDEDRLRSSQATSAEALFDTVFEALHDGEQVAVGVDCPLIVRVPSDRTDSDEQLDENRLLQLAAGVEQRPGFAQLANALKLVAHWRPWTTASASLARWRANTSILLWEADASSQDAESAIRGLFNSLRPAAGETMPPKGEPIVNVGAATAIQAGLIIDHAELEQPPLVIRAHS
jgi:hypothetical protein